MIKSKSAVGMLLGTLDITSRSVMTVVIVKSRGCCLETSFLVIWSWYIGEKASKCMCHACWANRCFVDTLRPAKIDGASENQPKEPDSVMCSCSSDVQFAVSDVFAVHHN